MTGPADMLLQSRELETENTAQANPQPWPEARHFLAGLALAATFGLALGGGQGALPMVAHAVVVPLGLVAVALVGGPAFYVALAHAGVDVSAGALAAALSRGIGAAGRVLSGLAPTMLLLAVTCESPVTVLVYGVVGLGAGGCVGLKESFRQLERLQRASTLAARLPRLAFAIFAVVLCLRVWWSLLQVLGGVR